ncbi:hypothetical protein CL633_04565 [bacterium]|jgi:hypothetical protein|nr:hypothetical protein [bacterium]|tara:strand:+ start:9147 stop:9440 length:294 start_codon:yes stop_codon:yes gene_type:complete
MKYYRKTSLIFDSAPKVKTPSAQDLTDLEKAILDFIDTGVKTDDEIMKEILVNQTYASGKGATGNDVIAALKSLESDAALETSVRSDGKFLEPVEEE